MPSFIVSVTPPTPNGDLHIGHIAGPFLSADVFTRVQRAKGHDCILVSYSDDYQSYMHRKELELGVDRIRIANENTALIKDSLAALGIEMSHWMSSYDNRHFHTAAAQVYTAARDAGAIVTRTSNEPLCPSCKTWGYEAFGRGNCNYCGIDSDASQCEQCAYPPEAARMQDFVCKLCGGTFDWPEVEREYLDVDRFKTYLSGLYASRPIRRPMTDWAFEVLDSGPKLWAITRPGEAGLDLHGNEACRLHTWFLGLAGYIATVAEYAEDVIGDPALAAAFWADPDARLVEFLGHDCAYSHMVVYPSLLSMVSGFALTPQFYPNQFMKLDGKNLSTSRGHTIWARDLAADYDRDAVRLFLASVSPEEAETDFEVAVFQRWYRTVWQASLNRLIDLASTERRTSASLAPEGRDDRALVDDTRRRWELATDVDTFSMQALAAIILDLIAIADGRANRGLPVARLVETIGELGASLHPDLSRRIGSTLAGIDGNVAPVLRQSDYMDA